MTTILKLEETGYENFYRVIMTVDGKTVSSGHASKYKILQDDKFVAVFIYANGKTFDNTFFVDQVNDKGIIILPKNATTEDVCSENLLDVWLFPDSSNIKKYRYNQVSMSLSIVFHSDLSTEYIYYNVEKYIFTEMVEAESKGKYFCKNVKGRYSWDKVPL